jgi:outer membrane receptor protein involved in Fe transport
VTYDIADNIGIYGQFSWAHASEYTKVGPVFRQGASGPVIHIDNPFLPAAIVADMTAAGVSSIKVGTFNQDLGPVNLNADRWSRRYLVGIDGKFSAFGSSWHWDTSAQRGETNVEQVTPGNISIPNYLAAIDVVANPATGVYQCRSLATNPGCRPWDVLGTGVNAGNQAALAYIQHPSISHQLISQNVFDGSLTGEPFSVPAGPVSVAFNAQHRVNTISMTRDDLSALAANLFNNAPLVTGSTNVTEGAFETVIPLLKGKFLADNWDFTGAVRYTSYNLAGNVTSWKVGSTYSPIHDIKFRVTRSRDIQAPNLQQNFDTGFTNRAPVADLKYNTTPVVLTTTTGNVDLKPEEANNFSAGIVLQPSWFKGFSISVDYWKVDLVNVISTIPAATIIAYCVEGIRPDFCSSVTRDPVTDVVTNVHVTTRNFASEKVSGVDVEASYNTSMDRLVSRVPGDISLHTNATINLNQTINSGLIGVTPINYVGEDGGANLPYWRLNTVLSYALQPVRVSLTERAFSHGKQFANYIGCLPPSCPTNTAANPTINNNSLPGAWYTDLSVMYDIHVGSASGSLFFNIKNLLDKNPPAAESQIFFAVPANAWLYDTIGREFRLGIRFKM